MLPLVALGEVGEPGEVGDGGVELRAVRQEPRGAGLGDGELAQLVGAAGERLGQLAQAAHPQAGVGGPAGGVEGAPGGGDRAVHVGGGGVGGLAQDLLGRRVDRLEAAGAGEELPVDQER
nr:hypothetical protein GCM10020093_108340 [Planobispora longispora]